jgi:predicted NAD/FAD-binding protein
VAANDSRLRIAVVGGGAAGITAAHVLQRAHDVTLFESAPELGGHAHAVAVGDGAGGTVEVDTAFLIYNQLHYPSFVALIRDLGVEKSTQPAEMSAAFIDDDKDFHYALARGADALFYQRSNLLRPGFYRLFAELVAFRFRAFRDMKSDRIDERVTLGEYLAPYSSLFRDNFVVPLATAIWSLPGDLVLAYPARHILRFFMNHRLLEGRSGDAWRTFIGGSGVYVRAFAERFEGRIRLRTPVREIRRDSGVVELVTEKGSETYDRVVLATHADVSLSLLAEPTAEEKAALGAWSYHPNTVVLHTDASVLHPDKRLWASWNVVKRGGRQRVTYYLNRVQPLASRVDYFLTLGDADVDPSREVARFSYRHPVFDDAAVATQPSIAAQTGAQGTYFCGSYAGHGFHEDAVASALRVGKSVGALL